MIYMYAIPRPREIVGHVVESILWRVTYAAQEGLREYFETKEYLDTHVKPLIKSHFRKRDWTPGRAGTGYETYSLAERGFWDCWIIRYPEGSHIPKHKDPAVAIVDFFRPTWTGQPKVFRLNVVLRPAEEGGEFRCEKAIFKTRRVAFFRPDKYEHEVTPVRKGTRYVFSFGFAV
jgi:hypothetical protein